MTDYLYSVSLASQTRLFLLSLGFGFFAGALYTFFRASRILLGSKKIIYKITDISYLVTLGFLNFLFFLSFNEGEIRFFALFGEVLGFVIYIFTAGITFSLYFEKFFEFTKKILRAVFNTLTKPFRKIRKKICALVKKHLKSRKKSENKSKYPLKVKKGLLYNLTNRNKNSEGQDKGDEQDAD